MIEELVQRSGVTDPVQLGYILGVMHAQQMRLPGRVAPGAEFGPEASDPPDNAGGGSGGCGCGSKE